MTDNSPSLSQPDQGNNSPMLSKYTKLVYTARYYIYRGFDYLLYIQKLRSDFNSYYKDMSLDHTWRKLSHVSVRSKKYSIAYVKAYVEELLREFEEDYRKRFLDDEFMIFEEFCDVENYKSQF